VHDLSGCDCGIVRSYEQFY